MDSFPTLGWALTAVATLYALGVLPFFARYFYPGSPDVSGRVVAPLIFAVLARACFAGLGIAALSLTTMLGMGLIVFSRIKRQRALKCRGVIR